MTRRDLRKNALSLTLAVALAASCALPAAAEPVGDGVTPTYDEAYYATLDYYGNLLKGSVVKSYALNGADSLTDYGVYDEVVNLTDSTAAAVEGGETSFRFGDAAPDHFYFEGKTRRPFQDLPWTVSLHYTLNGVPAKAEDLAGQRGVAEILLDIVPNESASDYARYNYTLAATAIFNQDDILSLEAPGAQVQLVGNLRTVLFLCLPGEEQHFTIRVGSDDFSFGGMTVLMVPATLAQLEEIAKLSQRKDDLEEDYRALSGSLDHLLDSLSDIQSGLYASAKGLDQLELARQSFSGGKGVLYDGADRLRGDLSNLAELLEPVEGRVRVLSRTVTESKAVLNELTDVALTLQNQLEDLEDALEKLERGTYDMKNVIRCAADLEDSLLRLERALGGVHVGGGSVSTNSKALVAQVKQARGVYDLTQKDQKEAFIGLMVSQGMTLEQAQAQVDQALELAKAPNESAALAATNAKVEQAVLASQGLTKEQFDALPEGDPRKAPLQAAITEKQKEAEAQVKELYPSVKKMDGIYQSGQGKSFQDFCGSLDGVTKEQAKQMNDLWLIYSSGSTKQDGPGSSGDPTPETPGPGADSGTGAGAEEGHGAKVPAGEESGGESGSGEPALEEPEPEEPESASRKEKGGRLSATLVHRDDGPDGPEASGGGDGSGDGGSGGADSSGDGGSGGADGSGDGGSDGGGDSEGKDPDQNDGPHENDSVGGAVVDLITGGLDSATAKIDQIQSELSSELNSIKRPTAAVAGELADLCAELDSLLDLLDDAEDLSVALRDDSEASGQRGRSADRAERL